MIWMIWMGVSWRWIYYEEMSMYIHTKRVREREVTTAEDGIEPTYFWSRPRQENKESWDTYRSYSCNITFLVPYTKYQFKIPGW